MTQLKTRLAVLFMAIAVLAVLLFSEDSVLAIGTAAACVVFFVYLCVREWRGRIE